MSDSHIKKTVQRAGARIPKEYILTVGEIMQLYRESQQDIFNALILAFNFGFIKGTRAATKGKTQAL